MKNIKEGQRLCTHSYTSAQYIIDKEDNPYNGYEIDNSHWEYTEVGTYEDISISQYKCTQCGKIFNYCGR